MATMLVHGFLLNVEASLTWCVEDTMRIPIVDLSHGTYLTSLGMCFVIVHFVFELACGACAHGVGAEAGTHTFHNLSRWLVAMLVSGRALRRRQ